MTRIFLSLSAFSLIQLLLIFTTSGVTADPLHIPVHRKRSAPRDVHYYAAAADRVRAKYGFPTTGSGSSKKRNGASISARFGKRASSAGISITDQTTIQYGSGAVAGALAQETVELGGFTVQGQTFRTYISNSLGVTALKIRCLVCIVLADELTSGLLDGPVSGIMGLGFEAIASTDSTPFWQALVNAGDLSSPEMSFWLARESSSTLTVQSESVSLGSSSQLSAIDTGTTLIGGPTDAVQNFYSSIEGSSTVEGQQGFFSFRKMASNFTLFSTSPTALFP
ncbi:hypothetical protein HHX47_DHR3000184 [Lentinula edodes]|nr:hypothetical protein HHX47_DHR3000184 [Lentinula edodes]